ncbi:hypothetical protein [Enterococcus faecalis]|uniref:hypothetical protein n=1 Tax=Enterococcus faecalis TaxID=1351 RepID=UPI0034CE2E1E
MKVWISFFIFISFFLFPIKSYAINSGGTVTYIPENIQKDPWEGGNITLEDSYIVRNNDISYNPILSRTVDFKIVWTSPEGITGQQMAQSIADGSTIEIGNQIVPIDKHSFSYSEDTITYQFNKSGFNFLALLRWLASLVLNPELTIKTKLILDVNSLSQNYEVDKSLSKVVTSNKLPPNRQKILIFSSSFYDRNEQKILNHSVDLPTWDSYISPWNKQQANSQINGKPDDTQTDNTTEVLGINRVLKGENYLNRVVQAPITETININDYTRVVNLYTKNIVNSFVQADSKIISEDFYEENNVPHFIRTTSYTFTGNDGQTTLSPVQMLVKQGTFLNLSLNSIPEQLSEYQPFEVTGEIESEGVENKYYYKIDDEQRVPVENRGKDQELKIEVEGLPAGKHQIVVGVSNEYDLMKEVQFNVNVANEEVKIISVTPDINFGRHSIPRPYDKLYNEKAFFIQVLDSYLTEKNWVLSAKIDQEMRTASNSILPADIYIKRNDKENIKLTKDFVPIYINEKINGGVITPIDFEQNKGIFLEMKSANVKTKEPYYGSIQFVINLGP